MQDTIATWWGHLVAALTWIVDRWQITATPPLPVIIGGLALVLAATSIRPVWATLRHAETIVHEMGHVVMAVLWGRRIDGISLHTDTSGLTISRGRPRGLGVLATYLAGYTAPPALGLGLVWASLAGYSGAALTALAALLIAAFWLVRNPFGLITITASLAAIIAALWSAHPPTVTATTITVGFFLLAAGVRTSLDLRAIHAAGNGQASDASMAAQHSLLPPGAWVLFFGLISLALTAQALRVLLNALA